MHASYFGTRCVCWLELIDCAASDPDGEVEPRGLVPVLYAHDELLQGKQERHVKDAGGLGLRCEWNAGEKIY